MENAIRSLTPSELHRRQQERKDRMTPTDEAAFAPYASATRPPTAPRAASPALLPREILERGSTPPFPPDVRERPSPPLLPKEVLKGSSPLPQTMETRGRTSPPLFQTEPPRMGSFPPFVQQDWQQDSSGSAQKKSGKAPTLLKDERVSPTYGTPIRERSTPTDNGPSFYGLALDYSSPSPATPDATSIINEDSDLAARQQLAEEVVKLRNEFSRLRMASGASPEKSRQDELQRLRKDIARLENEKAQAIGQANKDKAYFDLETKQLTIEIRKAKEQPVKEQQQLPQVEGDFLDRLRLRKEFEENFTRTLRDLRKELEETSLKEINADNRLPVGIRNMIQLSNERIDKVMEDAALIPVEERIHIETLRLLIENAKLRKILNDYSEGLLRNTMIKSDQSR